MNASCRWLEELLGARLDPREVRERLTMLGAAVDALEPLHQGLGEIVVAEVLEVRRHPAADRLWLCTVDAGSGASAVVCGAPTVRVGGRYPYVAVGRRIPGGGAEGGGGTVVARRKIRGVLSEGMLCSEWELGLGQDQEGILELDTDAAPGTPLPDALPLADTRLVVDVTPNRPDLLCHLGLARELGIALGKVVKLKTYAPPGPPAPRAIRAAGSSGTTAGVRVTIEDPEGCPRYSAAVLRGVRVGQSPLWLRQRLLAIGARPINNVVDSTNYVLYEVGQPLHAFDLAKLRGPAIVVRRAREGAGETITTLDGIARRLDPTMTVIADAEVPQAVAGVMGAAGSEVTESTSDVLLECAYFDPRRIRATRQRLDLSTEASYRYERGMDHGAVADNLARALELLLALAGGEVAPDPVDVYPAPLGPHTIFLRDATLARVLGVTAERSDVERALTALGCVVAPKQDRLAVQVPTFRPDLAREIDLVEEVARCIGYDRFPDEMRPFRVGTVPDAPSERMAARLRTALAALGLHEALTSPLGPRHRDDCVPVQNPLSQAEGYLRADLLPALVRRVEHNWGGHERDVRLFEIGNVFRRGRGPLPEEELRIAGVVTGARRPPHFSEPPPPDMDLFDAAALLGAAAQVATPGAEIGPAPHHRSGGGPGPAPVSSTWSGEGRDEGVVAMHDGQAIGWAGELEAARPPWAAPLFGFELVVGLEETPARPFAPPPKAPAVERDAALILPEGLAARDVERALKEGAGPLLEALWPFDEYRGGGPGGTGAGALPAGTRSVAWRLVFRASDRTLREAEADAALQRALDLVERRYGVRRRAT